MNVDSNSGVLREVFSEVGFDPEIEHLLNQSDIPSFLQGEDSTFHESETEVSAEDVLKAIRFDTDRKQVVNKEFGDDDLEKLLNEKSLPMNMGDYQSVATLSHGSNHGSRSKNFNIWKEEEVETGDFIRGLENAGDDHESTRKSALNQVVVNMEPFPFKKHVENVKKLKKQDNLGGNNFSSKMTVKQGRFKVIKSPNISTASSGNKGGNSLKNSTDSCAGPKFSFKEESLMVHFFLTRGGFEQRKGNTVWREMENVYPGRSWQSLKERFLKRILERGRLGEFGVTVAMLGEVGRTSEESGSFTLEEDKEILEFLVREGRFRQARGNSVWKLMVRLRPGARSWASLKQRYFKVMVRSLESYGLRGEVVEQMRGAAGSGRFTREL